MEPAHALIGLALRIKAHHEGPDAVKSVRQSLWPGKRQDTFDAIDSFMIKVNATELLVALAGSGVSQIGDGHILQMILDFLNQGTHWADILAIILKLLGG
jgi:hypothetical protein